MHISALVAMPCCNALMSQVNRTGYERYAQELNSLYSSLQRHLFAQLTLPQKPKKKKKDKQAEEWISQKQVLCVHRKDASADVDSMRESLVKPIAAHVNTSLCNNNQHFAMFLNMSNRRKRTGNLNACRILRQGPD